jgi:hypothetical protein
LDLQGLNALIMHCRPTRTWTVRATWDDGTFEEIAGFQNDADANDWITNKFAIWLEELKKSRQSC